MSSDASLRQYIFLQIRVYSMLKYPLQLALPDFIQQGSFFYLQKERISPVKVRDFPIFDWMFGDI